MWIILFIGIIIGYLYYKYKFYIYDIVDNIYIWCIAKYIRYNAYRKINFLKKRGWIQDYNYDEFYLRNEKWFNNEHIFFLKAYRKEKELSKWFKKFLKWKYQ